MTNYSIRKEEWDKILEQLILSYSIFATVTNESGLDYELLKPELIPHISYNKPKPATSLKNFFLPVKENVTTPRDQEKPRIIMGVPNCDIEGLNLLDEIYLDKDYTDIFFSNRRKQTVLISSDCFSIQEHCHCLSYDVKPYSSKTADLSITELDGMIIFRTLNTRGDEFVNMIPGVATLKESSSLTAIEGKHKEIEVLLSDSNRNLPDYKSSGKRVASAGQEIWKRYSSDCVSCGACTAICPTCTCFLLIDKPGFEKVRQMDACQYPGFERVAGGEDALYELPVRFRNRYMCKYFWKPGKFKSLACTGCGRCIEACIGKISKNELFMELA
jgi:sulfhydrogenase subunit beta (sulfur reductase)